MWHEPMRETKIELDATAKATFRRTGLLAVTGVR